MSLYENIVELKIQPLGGFFLATAEGCSLWLHQNDPSGPKVILPDKRANRQTVGWTDRWTDRRRDGRAVRQTTGLGELDRENICAMVEVSATIRLII